jgi:urease accessory protein
VSGPDLLVRPQLDLAFERRGNRTVLGRRIFSWPFVLARTFALDTAPAHMLTAILQTSAGAMHGEDRLEQRISVGPNAAAHIATPGATAVHRAHAGAMTTERVQLTVADGGYLEYMPEPRILFADSALDTALDLDCAPGATAIVVDAFTLRDPTQDIGSYESGLVVRRGGEPLVIDRLRLDRIEPRHFARYAAHGTVVIVAPLAPERLVDLSLALTAALARQTSAYAAASPLPAGTGIGVRIAASGLRELRSCIDEVWRSIRLDLTGALPTGRGRL